MAEIYAEKANSRLATSGYEFFVQETFSISQCVRPHIHTAIEVLFFVEGKYKISTATYDSVVSPGDTVMFHINELHRVYALSARGRYYVVKFSTDFVMQLAGTVSAPSHLLRLSLRNRDALVIKKTECDSIGLTDTVSRMMAESQSSDGCSELAVKICVCQLALILLRYISRKEPDCDGLHSDIRFTQRIYETIAYIEENYSSDITVDQCAAMANVSYSYFSRRFKAVTGKSFKQYLTDIRLDHAEKELCTTDHPITEIASACGFNSMAYFSAVFKNRSGMTPSQARDRLSPRR